MAETTLSLCLDEIKGNPGKFYVYLMYRPDGRPFYVGKGQRERIAAHEKYTRWGWRDIRFSIIRKIWNAGEHVRYRIASFHAEEADAFAAEMRLIAWIGRLKHGGPLVNHTDGGEGPSGFIQVATPETRAKLSAAMKGKPKSPEHVAKVVAANKGRKRSPELSVRLSAILKSPEINARMIAGRAGYRMADETKAKLREAKLGRPLSDDHRAKIGAAHRGQKRSPEAKANIAAGALKRPPVSPEECEKRRQRALAQPPKSEETKRKLSEAMKAARAAKKWGVSEEQRRQISATLKARNAKS